MTIAEYVEIPADDVDSARKFYEELFGWKIEKAPGDSDYWFIRTGDEIDPEQASGGMAKRQIPGQGITIMIEVDSVDDKIKKVKSLGGEIIMPKMNAMGMVTFSLLKDNQNNVFGIWEPLKE